MNCTHEHKIYEYFDGQLNAAQSIAFAEHLESCAVCSRRLGILKKTANAARELDNLAVSFRLTDKIMNSLPKRRPINFARWMLSGVGTAAAAAIIVLVVTNPIFQFSNQSIPDEVNPPADGEVQATDQIIVQGEQLPVAPEQESVLAGDEPQQPVAVENQSTHPPSDTAPNKAAPKQVTPKPSPSRTPARSTPSPEPSPKPSPKPSPTAERAADTQTPSPQTAAEDSAAKGMARTFVLPESQDEKQGETAGQPATARKSSASESQQNKTTTKRAVIVPSAQRTKAQRALASVDKTNVETVTQALDKAGISYKLEDRPSSSDIIIRYE